MKLKKKTVRFGASALVALLICFFVFQTTLCAQSVQTTPATPNPRQTRQYTDLIGSVLDFVQKNYVDEIDPEVLYRGAMKGMMDALGDPYTVYMDNEMMRSLTDTTAGQFGGVGLSISKAIESTPERPAYVEVASPIEDTPGWRAGILSGDYIISIDGTPTPDITMNEALAKLRGQVGTSVDLIIKRGENIEFPVTLVRALIEVPTVKFGMIEGGTVNGSAEKEKIGYLRIIEFTPNTARRVQDALDAFTAANFTGLIIDLRNNPGGLITSVVNVADKFIDSGVIVSTKSRLSGESSEFIASPRKTTMPKNIPIVVLINHGSASASEILSGAMKDNHLAYLVGETTYGKGSVQQPVPLPNADGIKLTISRYYTPSDANIDKVGIPPDREIKQDEYTPESEKAFMQLINDRTIPAYVEKHEGMTETDIASFAKTLTATYTLKEPLLRRLVRLEVKRKEPAMLYDLDYDVQLQEALKILRTENFSALIQTTKTLKELQAVEAAEKVAVTEKN